MRKLSLGLSFFVCIFCAMTVVATPTDIFTTLWSFRQNQGKQGTFFKAWMDASMAQHTKAAPITLA
jgi:hypothetical protein